MSDTPTPSSPPTRWAASFFTIWIGQAFSLAGSMLAGFALVWWITERTGSATVLATATLVSLLPGVFLGPFIGALVDRWNRRRVMIVADMIIALFSAALALLFWSGRIQVWHVYVIMFVRSLGGTFHWPAMQASTSLMVPKEQLARVAGANQTMGGILNIISPPMGALLIGLLPLHGIMAIDVVTAIIAIGPLLFIHIPQPARAAAAPTTVWQDVRVGFLYMWRWPGMFAILIMATLINMVYNPAFSLLPILVTRHFELGALELGWINSAWGFGIIAGGLTLSAWGGFKKRLYTSMLGLVGMGVGTILIGLAPAHMFWLALAGMALTGFMNPIANAPVFAMLQDIVDPQVQGRVFTVLMSVSAAASPLGMAVAGPLSDAVGVQVWFLVGGVMSMLMAAAALSIPAIVHLEEAGHARREPAAS